MDLSPARPRLRRISLTPMIDVVFLILIFFMLASRFSVESAMPVSGAKEASGEAWSGAPRVLTVSPGTLTFNNAPVDLPALATRLAEAGVLPQDAIVIRVVDGADVQRLTDILDALDRAGFDTPVLSP